MYQIALFVSYLLMTSLVGQAQTPDYLANGSKWRINWTGLSFTQPCWISEKYVVEIVGDTTMAGFTYKKLIHHGEKVEMQINPSPSAPPCAPFELFSRDYAYLRQDGMKMYIVPAVSQNEELLYDFDLQIGDTLPNTYNHNALDIITVTSIGSISVGSEARKVFYLSANTYNIEKIIEGIGHDLGLIGTMSPFELYETELVCFARNDTTYYSSPAGICDMNLSLTENAAWLNLTLYPNPALNQVGIESNQVADIKAIQAVDAVGRIVDMSFERVNDTKIEMDLSALESGIYCLRFTTGLGQEFVKIMSKQ